LKEGDIMALSTINPITVGLIKINNNIAYYKLRKNIQTVTSHNDLLNLDESLFQFDEVDLELTYTNENQINDIENSFETYWTLALEQLNMKKTLEEKDKQIKDLIENYKLIDINKQNETMINSLNQLSDMYGSTLDTILFNILPNLNK
jgi:hypothetical protein